MSESLLIALLEPDPTEVELLAFQLRKAGITFNFRRVLSKDQLLRTMETDNPDVVVANPATPRFDLAGTIAATASLGIPWVVYGVTLDEDTIIQAFHAGAVDVVSKKRIARFGSAIKRAVERPRPVTGAMTAPAQPVQDTQANLPVEPGDIDPMLLRRAIDGIADFFAVVDLDGKRVFNSGSYSGIIDDPGELQGTDCFVDIFPEDRDKIKLAFQTTIETGKGQLSEYRMMTDAGTVRYIESRGHLLRDAEGKPSHVVIMSRDITERRKREVALINLVESLRLSGPIYFEALVKYLGVTTGVRFVLVSVKLPQDPPRVRVLAFCVDGNLQPNFEYDLEGTVCATVFQERKMQYFPGDVQNLFPQEAALAAMGADAYLGQPLIDAHGEVRGHIFIMNNGSIRDPERAAKVLRMVTGRTLEELPRPERSETEQREEQSNTTAVDDQGNEAEA